MNSRFVKRTGKFVGGVLGVLFAIFVFALACGLSWILTCGIIKLITMCFGWTFSWLTSPVFGSSHFCCVAPSIIR